MADNKPSRQFKLCCVPNIDGNFVLCDSQDHSAEPKKWYIRVENDVTINSKLLWEQVKHALNLHDSIPDIVYCIMSYENEVRTRIRMKTFLQLLVQGALQTGALIITSGLCRGITKLLCQVIEEETKKYDGFCLKKEIYLIAIIAGSQIAGRFQRDETTQEPHVIYSYTGDENSMATFDIRHDLFILVEKGNSTKDNLTRTSKVALGLVKHLKKTYSDSVFKTVPKGGNEEREFHWNCDGTGCGKRIIGQGRHCQECGDCDLCYVCARDSDKWPERHSAVHDSQLKTFDTWNTGRCRPRERSKGSWRCTGCSKHIWDKIYYKEDHGVLCGNCYKWEEDSSSAFEEIKLESTEIRPVSVTWFLLQGGKDELEAACDAINNGVRLLATYGDGGNTAELVSFIYTNVNANEGSITTSQIKCMVNSTLVDDEADTNAYVECLKGISRLTNPENKIITCGCELFSEEQSVSDIISNGLIKASTDSYQSQLLLMTMWKNKTDEAKSILKQNINRQCISYHEIMKSALVLGKASFLELFLDYGMPLQPFCNRETLEYLYRSVLSYKDVTVVETSTSLEFLRTMFRDNKLCEVGILSKLCIRSSCRSLQNEVGLLSKVADAITYLTSGTFDNNYGNEKCEITEKDLYLWAILCGRYEMAKLIWNKAPDHIALALIGSRVLRRLSRKAAKYEESHLRDDLAEQGRKFEEFASDAIQECYDEDKTKSHQLLTKPIRNINGKHEFTCLTLAGANHQERFMSQTSCKTKLTKMWFEDVRYKEYHSGFFSPSFQFFFNIMMMAMLLFLMTTFVLTELHDSMGTPTILEVTVMVWICCLTVEEIRLIYFTDRVGWRRKLKSWFLRQWNAVKAVMVPLYMASVIARFTVPTDSFTWVHVLYSVTLLAFYLNLLTMGFASNQLGLKLIMIKGMVKELFLFLAILLVFIFGFGVAYEALLYPRSIESSRSMPEILSGVIYKSYFQIHGDLLTEDIEGDDVRCVESFDRGCFIEVIIPILTGVYVLITTILLLNLLIAVFTFCIEDINTKSELIWGFYRYGLTKEYMNKVPFFPFGCAFYWTYLLLRWFGWPFYWTDQLLRWFGCPFYWTYQKKGYMATPKDDKVLGAKRAFDLEQFEHKVVDAYWRKVRATKNDLDDTDTIKDVRMWKKNYTADK